MFNKLSRWFNHLPIWGPMAEHPGCVVGCLIAALIPMLWVLVVGVLRLLLGWINTAFQLSFTDIQLWVGAVGLYVLAWLFGGKGIHITTKNRSDVL